MAASVDHKEFFLIVKAENYRYIELFPRGGSNQKQVLVKIASMKNEFSPEK